jgi:hypothetical protein
VKRKTRFAILSLGALICILFVSVPVLAYSLSGYYWAEGYACYNDDDIPYSSWRTAIASAANSWNDDGNSPFRFYLSYSDHDWGIANLGGGSTLATTYRVVYGDNTICDYDTYFNSQKTFYTDGSQYDVEAVALHEFGHWLDLNDLYDWWDCYQVMYYQYLWCKHDLSNDEVNGIQAIYGQE